MACPALTGCAVGAKGVNRPSAYRARRLTVVGAIFVLVNYGLSRLARYAEGRFTPSAPSAQPVSAGPPTAVGST